MKRDMELIRIVLLSVEEKAGDPRGWVNLEIPGHSNQEISYHVTLLQDAGLLESCDLSGTVGFDVRPKRLTWNGHEFLDAAKNDTVWKKALEIGKEKVGS